ACYVTWCLSEHTVLTSTTCVYISPVMVMVLYTSIRYLTETSTIPRRAKVAPSNHGWWEDPDSHPPPWNHTSTGWSRPTSGAQTSTCRMSVPATIGSGIAGSGSKRKIGRASCRDSGEKLGRAALE